MLGLKGVVTISFIEIGSLHGERVKKQTRGGPNPTVVWCGSEGGEGERDEK